VPPSFCCLSIAKKPDANGQPPFGRELEGMEDWEFLIIQSRLRAGAQRPWHQVSAVTGKSPHANSVRQDILSSGGEPLYGPL
jgi:hypothetical protein